MKNNIFVEAVDISRDVYLLGQASYFILSILTYLL